MPKYKKCPRCELNYIPEDREYCDVCEQELRGLEPGYPEEEPMLCAKCHQNICEPGEEYCSECLREKANGEFYETDGSELMPGAKISSLDELSDNEWEDTQEESFDDNDGFGNSADLLDDNVEEDFGEGEYDPNEYEEESQPSVDYSYVDNLDEEDIEDEDEEDYDDDEDFDDFGEELDED